MKKRTPNASPATKKRPSGGARATVAKHGARSAARRRGGDFAEKWFKRYRDLGPAPIGQPTKAHGWIADLVLLALEEAASDPGPPLEQRREQLGRLAAQAVKVLDPAKLSVKLAELEAALQEAQDARRISS